MEGFEYVKAHTIDEALRCLQLHGDQASIYGGGTDLIVQMKAGLRRPKCLVDVKGIPGLAGMGLEADGRLRIGALTTMRQLETSPVVARACPALAQAAAALGSLLIRNRATLGGNICHASPSAETAPALLALDASVSVAGHEKSRTMPLDVLFLGPGVTALSHDELLVEICIPREWVGTSSIYLRHSIRGALDLAVVGVGVALRIDTHGCVVEARIGLGAVAPTPVRALAAEEMLRGQRPTEEIVHQASLRAVEATQPISDSRGSAEYRKHLTEVLVERALTGALFPKGEAWTGK
ncbi:MAG: xanthine dehydrogenase family protein subunit M [Anaerolineales bacterium]